jgi:hypothetical protein
MQMDGQAREMKGKVREILSWVIRWLCEADGWLSEGNEVREIRELGCQVAKRGIWVA